MRRFGDLAVVLTAIALIALAASVSSRAASELDVVPVRPPYALGFSKSDLAQYSKLTVSGVGLGLSRSGVCHAAGAPREVWLGGDIWFYATEGTGLYDVFFSRAHDRLFKQECGVYSVSGSDLRKNGKVMVEKGLSAEELERAFGRPSTDFAGSTRDWTYGHEWGGVTFALVYDHEVLRVHHVTLEMSAKYYLRYPLVKQ